MNEEKRKIGEYTVLCSVNVGEKEVILASNEQSTNGDKFLCGFAERNDLFELCSECMVSDDYIEIVHLFGSRVTKEAEFFKEQVEKLDIPITLITEADCIPDHYSKDINGTIIAIDPKVLKPEFQRADRQLYYVTGGFGASANSRGSAVFCTNLHTGKSTRYERMDVMGEVKPERLPEWAKAKRRDKSRVVLRTGESQRADGTYHYCWTDANRKRRYVYAKTLDELRYKEEQIEKDKKDGIKAEARYTTLNDIYELWKDLKRGLKNNTFENYKYMYETFVRQQIGSKTVSSLKKSDIKRFYNYLADERHLKPATIDNIHTVLHQILDMAVDDDYLRNNPSNNVLKELKQSHCFQTEKRRALTRPEQELLLSYLKNTPSASLWYPIFAVLIGTGLRVGEATGLRWCDIDLEEGIIDVNHTLVYYDHRTEGSKRGCYFNINTTKTPAGKRQVPMLDFVKEAFLMEKERQELLDIHCEAVVDGYTDFIFLNRFGQPQHQATLNKAIRRIIRDCNDEQLLKDENAKILLPHFSCHSLRHTFTTRMCEAGVNVKVIQDTLGHKDISTTLNIYTDVTKELRRSEFEGLDSYFKNEYNKAANI